MFGKRIGWFRRRPEQIIEGALAIAPDLVPTFETPVQARREILFCIAPLDSRAH